MPNDQARCFATMTSIANQGDARDKLNSVLNQTVETMFPSYSGQFDSYVTLCKQNFSDYQSNIALHVAKELKLKPLDIANKIKDNLNSQSNIYEKVTVTGPGFINFILSDDYIKARIGNMINDPNHKLGLNSLSPDQKKRIIVDFSSPNIAKEMHVGHLRSTIIGDTISNILEFLGHDVIRINHVGDWGTQFGMLIHYMKVNFPDAIAVYLRSSKEETDYELTPIQDLANFYKAAKKCFDENLDGFQDASRNEVVKLQSGEKSASYIRKIFLMLLYIGDEENVLIWKAICQQSRKEFQTIYNILNINITERGESFYNPYLEQTVKYFKSIEVATENQGACCVFMPGYINEDRTPLPLIIQKSDGGYLYATTDLAALNYRINVDKAQRIIYVTDRGQSQHFAMVFDAAKLAKIIPPDVEVAHVSFDVVQGEDGKKLKSRSGDTVKLKELLDDAVRFAEEDMKIRKSLKNPSSSALTPEELEIARRVGISAVKYADLSINRDSFYRFSFKKMLSMTGNTAPYMLYSYARIQSIKRKAVEAVESDFASLSGISPSDLIFSKSEEMGVVKLLVRWDEVLLEVNRELYPSKMCEYIYDLCQKFNLFYENCHVINAETKQERISRAVICSVTSDVLRNSLKILGIPVLEKL